MFKQSEIDSLWDRIKDARCEDGPTGLIPVQIELSLEQFTSDYKAQLGIVFRRAHVTTSIPDALRHLEDARIENYHISCVGADAIPPPDALCIHYEKAYRAMALAIPGVSYFSRAELREFSD